MNKHIDDCGYSKLKILMIFAIIVISTIGVILISKVNNIERPIELPPPSVVDSTDSSVFVPTAEDIEAQDSIWVIVNQTSLEVDTIHQHIDQIILKIDDIMDRMEMDCGDTTSYIDKTKEDIDWTGTYQDEYVMWIGANGDTIWE